MQHASSPSANKYNLYRKAEYFLMYFMQHWQLGTCYDESTVRATLNQYSLVWQKTGWLPKPKAFHQRALLCLYETLCIVLVSGLRRYSDAIYLKFSPFHTFVRIRLRKWHLIVSLVAWTVLRWSIWIWAYILQNMNTFLIHVLFLWTEYCNLKKFNE